MFDESFFNFRWYTSIYDLMVFHIICNMSDNILLNFGNPIKWNRVPSWLYCSWIYNYLCNQSISPLKFWVWIPLRRGSMQRYVIKLMRQFWLSPGTLVSSTNKTDHHDITEILLKVALNTITLSPTLKWNRLKYRTTIWNNSWHVFTFIFYTSIFVIKTAITWTIQIT
jgi:hypothetical protein